MLEDCGHCIEVEGLEGWLTQTDTEVGMKKCPKCRNAIYTNRRYQHLVLEAYEGVRAIKDKYYKARNAIKRKDIELILQGKIMVVFCFGRGVKFYLFVSLYVILIQYNWFGDLLCFLK